MKIGEIFVAPDVVLYHTGPSLDLGPLPSLFYFSLSGPDSLGLDPFNQPVQFLQGKMIRVFSMTLPGHENNLPATEAMQVWADDFAKGRNPVASFLEQFDLAFAFACKNGFIAPEKVAVAGLSRGGFIAFHIAAREEKVKHVLAFAPATDLALLKEFRGGPSYAPLNPKLPHQQVRIYIGNHDTRVGTRQCFDFAMSIVDSAREASIRSPKVEWIMYPSIGLHGHGTPPEIFKQGAEWIQNALTSS